MLSARGTRGGFTLVEILIVCAIISGLLIMAVPGYQRHMGRAERTDARAMLYRLGAAQERFFIQNGRYASTMAELGQATPAVTGNGRYGLSVQRSDSDGYVLRATRLAADAEARRCQWFELDQTQARASSPGVVSECWMR